MSRYYDCYQYNIILLLCPSFFAVDAEMKSFANSSKSKYKVENDIASDQRIGSPSSDYVVIEKSGEQPNGIVQREIESTGDNHRISPTSSSVSMSSEAESTTTNKAPTKVFNIHCYC